ncbi:PepSY domain-containing protein [uncultured Phenylobacterium sp.]|uniref:PepSY-associated TM helix domain-containing protein n=1 Tax=uncultured Phenylobacterium sp. TaxID=349273 RepID=UPI0025EE4635|nr:PepSY-associated TM helix domain-containing protein [uncultured Phenylobacterium sp.]
MTPQARLRRFWLDVHLWIGVGLLVAFIPLAVTGSILVWHDPLDRALHASRYATSGSAASLPPAAYAAAAQTAFGDRAQLTQLRFPQEPGDPVVAVGRLKAPPGPGGRPRTLNAWIDPPSGRVLGTGEVAKEPSQVMHRIHGSLLIPEVGRKVVGWLGWAMFVSSATGLWLWWPRHGSVLKALRWRRGPSTLFNLHHLVGFWVCIPLAVLSLTGVYISFPQTSRALFGLPPVPPRAAGPGRFAPPLPEPRTSLAAAVAAAQSRSPGAALTEISAPTRGKDPAWRIGLKAPGAERAQTIQVLDATGEIKPGRDGAPPSNRDPISRLMRQVHDGNDMGLVWQVIITAAGAAPVLLGITGIVMWLRRSARRRAITRGTAA